MLRLSIWGNRYPGLSDYATLIRPTGLACAYEAVLGAVYLDGGFGPTLRLVAAHFAPDLEHKPAVQFDSKTRLQELTQKIFKQTPTYEVVEVTGPDHQKRFVSRVIIAGKAYGRARDRAKSAHLAAASQTLALLQTGLTRPSLTLPRLGTTIPDKSGNTA